MKYTLIILMNFVVANSLMAETTEKLPEQKVQAPQTVFQKAAKAKQLKEEAEKRKKEEEALAKSKGQKTPKSINANKK